MERKKKKFWQGILPGNGKSLWKAVYYAKDMCSEYMPSIMLYNGIEIKEKNLAESFANYFESKIEYLVSRAYV